MSWWIYWFGTATEKKREQYKALYNDLNRLLNQFNTKLKAMETSVSSYESGRPNMSSTFIPEDIFSESESRLKTKVTAVRDNQSTDVEKLSAAVDAAYNRYKYYEMMANQERLEREAEDRRQAEIRRLEAEKRKGR